MSGMMTPDPYAVLALRLSPDQKIVLLDLALHVHHGLGPQWPTISTLAADTGLSADAVRDAIAALSAAGHIQVDAR